MRHSARGMAGISIGRPPSCSQKHGAGNHGFGNAEGSEEIRLTSFDSSQFGVRAQ